MTKTLILCKRKLTTVDKTLVPYSFLSLLENMPLEKKTQTSSFFGIELKNI